ncbi:glycosyltransferase family 4 protein [Actinoplanes sp. NPDC051633]|uniref:glycosyltransferase family 4 protein n=1 Tax=Actinoplanes sp. NPDC051633 TaxID=3155670 RepID=UPI00341E4D51
MSTSRYRAVYVALGKRRPAAARALTAGDPSWLLATTGDGLLERDGPLAHADLMVAGDPEAMPIALAARRLFPRLRIATDVAADPDRRPAPAGLAVVTPWYPCPNDPFAGAFVQAATRAVGDAMGRVSTLHTENWYYSPHGLAGKKVEVAFGRQLDRQPGVTVEDTAEGELTRVVAPQRAGADYVTWARSQTERLRAVLPTGRIEAPVVHAHTGHYAGVVAAALIRDDAKLVVTEHATFLDKVFAQPAARRAYGAMLARASVLLCVGASLRDQIADRFPQHAGKLRVVPNPIDFDRFAVRPAPAAAPLRWLYIGRMLEHKGVRTLLEAFARVAAGDDRVTLTLVGSGALVEPLGERIAELGLTGRVTQRPPVAPDEVGALLHEHDVLTHASRSETFGITLIEAIATQTPVLAARSEGPAETLAGLDHVAGQLFEPTDDPDAIVAAYRKLAEAWPRLDLAAARERLRTRYGREAVGAQLREIYREEPVLAGPATEAEPVRDDRITVVAIDQPGNRRAREFVTEARRRGYGVDLITAEPEPGQFDAGVRVHAIGADERRRAGRRLVEGLVTAVPRRALRLVRAGTRKLSSPLPEALAITAERGHRRVADKITKRVYGKYYAVVRPRILWRITRRRVLPSLDLSRTRRVVVHGAPGVTIGWGLARRNPAMSVGTDLTLPAD